MWRKGKQRTLHLRCIICARPMIEDPTRFRILAYGLLKDFICSTTLNRHPCHHACQHILSEITVDQARADMNFYPLVKQQLDFMRKRSLRFENDLIYAVFIRKAELLRRKNPLRPLHLIKSAEKQKSLPDRRMSEFKEKTQPDKDCGHKTQCQYHTFHMGRITFGRTIATGRT